MWQKLHQRGTRFWALHFGGPAFRLWGRSHWVALGLIALLLVAVWGLRDWPPAARLMLRYGAGALLVVNELLWHAWNIAHHRWTLRTMLPLHLCSFMVWGGALLLFTGNAFIYDYLYFLGIGGALQALLTPDLSEHDFPHLRYFTTFISHGLIVWTGVYMTVVEGYRPTMATVGQVVVGTQLLMLVIGLINWRLGSNYMYLAHPPETPSLIDKLGPWPWYLLPLELMGLLLALVLYAPFALYDWLTLGYLR